MQNIAVLLWTFSVIQCVKGLLQLGNNATGKNFVYNSYKYNSTIHITLNETVEHFLDFYEESSLWSGYPTRVHVSSNDTLTGEYPLFITATQQKGVSSWQLPLVVTTKTATLHFNDVSRTLCPHDAGPNITTVNRPSLQITTSSPSNLTATIKVRRVKDFYVEVDKKVEIVVQPSTPKYYYFSFDSTSKAVPVGDGLQYLPRFNYSIPKSVVLMIESDDEICATISIQNNSCPVFDNEREVLYQGYHFTMTTKGGITLTQSMFPHGFYIVFIVRENDAACTGEPADSTHPLRKKTFRLVVSATISYVEYATAAAVALALAVVVAILVALLPLLHTACRREEQVVVLSEEPGPSTPRESVPDEEARDAADDWDDDSSTASPPEWGGVALTVAGLSRRAPASHQRRAHRYFWISLTVAVVYALPVVQLLFTYQKMVYQTGDQDVCYYNFLCAHPLGVLSDANHVFSNAAYALLGVAFMAQVWARGHGHQDRGVPQQRGLLYSMGLALAMEGLLSACYHLCPNKMNFQFDSSFMYVIAVLCTLKLYQSRHADVAASAHSAFMLIALVMAVGVVGIMYPSLYFWAAFTALHLATCFVLTLKIYYVGQFKLERGVLNRGISAMRRAGVAALRPAYGARAGLLAAANAANWALAAYGLYWHNKDFARHLLAILMGNALLYTIFYVIMKLVHGERLVAHCWAYLVGTAVMWTLAVRLFLDARTKWSQTPAQSRRHNAPCSALQFFDTHDLWHGASAAAVFLYYNMLLTVDDALADTHRDVIPVF